MNREPIIGPNRKQVMLQAEIQGDVLAVAFALTHHRKASPAEVEALRAEAEKRFKRAWGNRPKHGMPSWDDAAIIFAACLRHALEMMGEEEHR